MLTDILEISPLMVPLGLCALLAISIVCERLWVLRMKVLAPKDQIQTLHKTISESEASEAYTLLKKDRQANMLQRLVVIALESQGQGMSAMRDAVKFESDIIAHELHRFLSLLGAVAMISPLLGLLGTVLGLMDVFAAMLAPDSGVELSPHIHNGIAQALTTTAVGLIVAIPSAFFHRLLQRRANSLVIALETQCMHTIRDCRP